MNSDCIWRRRQVLLWHSTINWWVLPGDIFFLFTDMNTGTTKQMEDICRPQGCHYSRKNIFSNKETCVISIQSCWSHFTRNWAFNTFNMNTKEEGITDHHRYHHAGLQQSSTLLQTTWKSDMYKLHFYTNQKNSLKDSPSWKTHQIYCMLQNIQQLQTSQGHQAHKHCSRKILTRLWYAVWRW